MTNVGFIDSEKHAEEVLEMFNEDRERFVTIACNNLTGGMTPEDTRQQIRSRIKRNMRDTIFHHLVRTGAVRGTTRIQYLSYTCYRTVHYEPSISEVPSKYLDIDKILPNFSELVDAIMLDAGKLKITKEIEKITTAAQDAGEPGND